MSSRRAPGSTRIPRALVVAGTFLVGLGLAGLLVAVGNPDLIRSRIPGLAVDAAAVGGAAAALATAVMTTGVAHLLLAVALRRGVPWSIEAGICLALLLGALLLASGAAAWVAFAAGGGLAPVLGGIGLCAAAALYLALGVALIGQKGRSDGSEWL